MYAGERGPLMRIAFCVHHPCLAAALIAPPHETRACAPSRSIPPAFPLACCSQCYPGGLNRSVCCHQGVCTECYLQAGPNNTAYTQ